MARGIDAPSDHFDRDGRRARTAAIGVIAGLCLFAVGAVVPYWDGGVRGGPPPPAGVARRLIDLPTEYLFSVHFWRTEPFWRILGWLAVFAATLVAARAITGRTSTRRLAAGFLLTQGAILLLSYLLVAAPLWTDISAGEPLALLWPLGSVVIAASGFLTSRIRDVSMDPQGLRGSRLLAMVLLLGAGLIVIGHFFSWHSRQTIPFFVWQDWTILLARQSYWPISVLGAVVAGAVLASVRLYRTRSVTPALLGATLAGALWVVSLAAPILISFGLSPYVSTRAGLYVALTGAILLGAAAIHLWRGSSHLRAS